MYAFVIRPWMLGWGSTAEERTRPLPGDDIEPDAEYVTTRATTIQAPAAAVWPWSIQMGQDRAGFYTHNWVERVLRSGIPDTAEIRPEWQGIEIGDLERTNRDIGGKPMGWPVAAVDPGRSLVVTSKSMPAGTYAFAVETGLISGVRQRAERRDRSLPQVPRERRPRRSALHHGHMGTDPSLDRGRGRGLELDVTGRFRGLGVGSGVMDRPRRMLGGGVDRVQAQISLSDVHDVVASPRRHMDEPA